MKKIMIILAMVVTGVPAIAQTGQEEVQKKLTEDAVPLKHDLIKNSYSPFKAKLSSFLSKLSLSSTFNTGENARADLSYVTNKDSDLVVGISVNQQLGKTDIQGTPFDLTDGLYAGTTVGFNFSYISWKPKLSAAGFNSFNRSADSYASRKNIDRRTVTYNDIRDHGNNDEKKLLPKLRNPVFFNLSISFSKTSYSFTTDSSALTENDVNYITPDINFSIGFLSSVKSYLAVSYTYSKICTPAAEVTFSSPFGTTGNLISQTIAFGAPVKTNDSRISIQWSRIFGDPVAIGISPTLTYGFTSKDAAITLPVYFIKGATGDGKPNGLQGGIQLGYITSTNSGSLASFKDGFGAQLIIGVPFNVFGVK